MGMDSVELVMTVEETFDITIPDADAETIQTVGHLYQYILSKVQSGERETSRCLSAATFYRLRRGLVRTFRVPRREVRPQSQVEALIPVIGRKSEWRRLGASLGWELPGLVHPAWVGHAWIGLFIAWSATIVLVWARFAGFAPESIIPVGLGFLVGVVLLGGLFFHLMEPFAIHIPPECVDVRRMVTIMLARNLGKIRGEDQGEWNRKEVWEVLTTIIAEQVGVSREQLTESTSFVNDLF